MRISHIAPMKYTPGKLEYSSFIRGQVGADYHQGPTFHVFPDGRVMMIWQAYEYDECSNTLVLLYSVSDDRGVTWSDPQVYMADHGSAVPYALRFLRLRGASRTLLWISGTVHEEIEVDGRRRVRKQGLNYFKCHTRLVLRESADGGKTFNHGAEFPYREVTAGQDLPEVGFYGAVEGVTQLAGGRVLTSFIYMDPLRSDPAGGRQHFTAVFLYSDDQGRTWRRSNEVVVTAPRGAMEPTVVETAPDQLYCLLRTKAGYLYETRSRDGGATWTEPRSSGVPAPESMARLLKLQSGNVILVWNNVSSATQYPRHPLSCAIWRDPSSNDPAWSEPRIIADETGLNQLSNHDLVQLDDGRILLGISHYHSVTPMTSDLDMAIFDEAWLKEG